MTQAYICEKLDVRVPFGNDYRALADEIGMSPQQIKNGNGKGEEVLNPIEQILQWWGSKNDPTVRRLVEILRVLNREDVVEIIMKEYQQ